MSRYNRLILIVILIFAAAFLAGNLLLPVRADRDEEGLRKVEIERVTRALLAGSEPDISSSEYISAISPDDGSDGFVNSGKDIVLIRAGGKLYRLELRGSDTVFRKTRVIFNAFLAAAAILSLAIMIYIRQRIIKPFNRVSELPYELSRGNLTVPVDESGGKYFGRFIWGTDMLREKLEDQKARELAFQRDKQTLLLSVSHDIKTPLSAIKLSAKALSKGIYTDKEKLSQVYENIGHNADEIEQYVKRITDTASDDFLSLDVNIGEIYLSELVERVRRYYTPKLELIHTGFIIGDFSDCLIKCDVDRAEEVMQNIIENAVKYGDGKEIKLSFSEEEDCRLITVSNSGTPVSDDELIHIFDSFKRGSNSAGKPGSGLGLYICRRLMASMDGDIFARTDSGQMQITAVFRKV